jgi:putative hydrolase of the HAD superfamily
MSSSESIVRHALFDFGGPLLLTPFELGAAAARALGVDESSLAPGPFDPDRDPRWKAWQAGEITERQYWAERAEPLGIDVKAYMRAFYEPTGDHLVRPLTWSMVTEVQAAGFRVGVLTNDLSAFHSAEWAEGISVFKQIDTLVDLSMTGHLKPHPLAYAAGIAAMTADPADIVFLDDQLPNVNAARDAGMTAVWFDPTDVDASVAAFRAALTAR